MDCSNFIIVGENIHCTRMVKRGGIKMTEVDGKEAVKFKVDGEERHLLVPANWGEVSPDYEKGKCKHVALAIHQALNGSADDQKIGEEYLCYVAERQINKGATFLDVNVDEYSSDSAATVEIMDWLTKFLSERYDTPLSIDSSNPKTLSTGLENCRKELGPAMVNSISLEREDVIDVVKQYDADAIVSAAGKADLPADVEGRLTNFRAIIAKAEAAGIARSKMHLDPLVLPISTDSMNGKHFLDSTSQAKAEFPECHFNGGLSNISFGMPSRKLLNQVFIWLCMEAGTDGGIIDPAVIPMSSIEALDPESEKFQLAKAVLVGEDMFGMAYISAYRDGKLK